eukprot:TRINITY_DN29700_c0_g3_i2.p1 TRINITY_DN29700_c0_g3~~TRINITY_DN29700_c0_g3_i2.p1  ORF type:complete len:1224 (+),score=297.46 TRINITY_DN29700_c0_g3_i2:64-3735(+)
MVWVWRPDMASASADASGVGGGSAVGREPIALGTASPSQSMLLAPAPASARMRPRSVGAAPRSLTLAPGLTASPQRSTWTWRVESPPHTAAADSVLVPLTAASSGVCLVPQQGAAQQQPGGLDMLQAQFSRAEAALSMRCELSAQALDQAATSASVPAPASPSGPPVVTVIKPSAVTPPSLRGTTPEKVRRSAGDRLDEAYLEALEQQLQEALDVHENLRSHLRQERARVEELEDILASTRKTAEGYARQHSALRVVVADLERQLAESRGVQEVQVQEHEEARSRIADLESSVEQAQDAAEAHAQLQLVLRGRVQQLEAGKDKKMHSSIAEPKVVDLEALAEDHRSEIVARRASRAKRTCLREERMAALEAELAWAATAQGRHAEDCAALQAQVAESEIRVTEVLLEEARCCSDRAQAERRTSELTQVLEGIAGDVVEQKLRAMGKYSSAKDALSTERVQLEDKCTSDVCPSPSLPERKRDVHLASDDKRYWSDGCSDKEYLRLEDHDRDIHLGEYFLAKAELRVLETELESVACAQSEQVKASDPLLDSRVSALLREEAKQRSDALAEVEKLEQRLVDSASERAQESGPSNVSFSVELANEFATAGLLHEEQLQQALLEARRFAAMNEESKMTVIHLEAQLANAQYDTVQDQFLAMSGQTEAERDRDRYLAEVRVARTELRTAESRLETAESVCQRRESRALDGAEALRDSALIRESQTALFRCQAQNTLLEAQQEAARSEIVELQREVAKSVVEKEQAVRHAHSEIVAVQTRLDCEETRHEANEALLRKQFAAELHSTSESVGAQLKAAQTDYSREENAARQLRTRLADAESERDRHVSEHNLAKAELRSLEARLAIVQLSPQQSPAKPEATAPDTDLLSPTAGAEGNGGRRGSSTWGRGAGRGAGRVMPRRLQAAGFAGAGAAAAAGASSGASASTGALAASSGNAGGSSSSSASGVVPKRLLAAGFTPGAGDEREGAKLGNTPLSPLSEGIESSPNADGASSSAFFTGGSTPASPGRKSSRSYTGDQDCDDCELHRVIRESRANTLVSAASRSSFAKTTSGDGTSATSDESDTDQRQGASGATEMQRRLTDLSNDLRKATLDSRAILETSPQAQGSTGSKRVRILESIRHDSPPLEMALPRPQPAKKNQMMMRKSTTIRSDGIQSQPLGGGAANSDDDSSDGKDFGDDFSGTSSRPVHAQQTLDFLKRMSAAFHESSSV